MRARRGRACRNLPPRGLVEGCSGDVPSPRFLPKDSSVKATVVCDIPDVMDIRDLVLYHAQWVEREHQTHSVITCT